MDEIHNEMGRKEGAARHRKRWQQPRHRRRRYHQAGEEDRCDAILDGILLVNCSYAAAKAAELAATPFLGAVASGDDLTPEIALQVVLALGLRLQSAHAAVWRLGWLQNPL